MYMYNYPMLTLTSTVINVDMIYKMPDKKIYVIKKGLAVNLQHSTQKNKGVVLVTSKE